MQGLEVGDADGRVVFVVYSAIVEHQYIGVVTEHLPGSFQQLISDTDGRTNGCIGVHEGDTAGVGPKIDWTGVALMTAHVNHFNGKRKHLGYDLCNGRCGALANVGRPGMYRNATIHIDLNVDGSVREILWIPVDGKTRARNEETATDTDALAEWKLTEFLVPVRAFTDPFKRFSHAV